jgi:hypothetical protein
MGERMNMKRCKHYAEWKKRRKKMRNPVNYTFNVINNQETSNSARQPGT